MDDTERQLVDAARDIAFGYGEETVARDDMPPPLAPTRQSIAGYDAQRVIKRGRPQASLSTHMTSHSNH